MQNNFIEFLISNGLCLFPLYSIKNGLCTCLDSNCTSPGKHPSISFSWKVIATSDIKKINVWIEKGFNFALATGRKSKVVDKYLVVVDVDKIDHKIFQKLSDTLTIKTKNGFHKYYWSKYPIKNSVSLIDENVDIRGTNGYVVIPPSEFAGGKYEVVNENLSIISDLPQFIYDIIFNANNSIKQQKSSIKKKTQQMTKNVSGISKKWSEHSILEIKAILADPKELIPCGIRNDTCFRLLASARAKGIFELSKLIEIGKTVRNKMEDKLSFTDEEIEKIAKSVMRYPAYNNLHEEVNSGYLRWLENRGISLDESCKDNMLKTDEMFFSKLQKTNGTNKEDLITLKNIQILREDFLKSKGISLHSNYKSQLLAKKLKDLGISRVRTSRGNLWAVSIQG